MYGSLRFKVGFHEEVDKFIEAVEKYATTLTENKDVPVKITRTVWHGQM